MTGYTFNQLFDFTRTTAATFVGSNGLIQTTPASVNLLTFTQEFDNAAWGRSNATVAANSTLAPDGTATADTFIDDVVNGPHNAVENVSSAVAGQTYTLSLYAKASTSSVIQILGRVATMGTNVWANFNLATGTIGTVGTSTTASIVNVGNGWYRCIVTGVATASGTGILAFLLTNNDANAVRQPSYAGTGTGVFLWGAQLELGSTATTYARNNGGLFPPRFDYDPLTLAPRGILIEEQRTNLLLRSEEFGNVYWSPTGVTVTSNSIASPDGAITADTLVEDTSTGVHRVFATPSCSASTTYTFSAYVKAAGRTQVRLLETTLGGAFFDLSAVTVITTDPGVTASITNVGNGWYRCRVTSTTGGAQTLYVAQIQGSVAANNTYTGSGAAALYVWGAQVEAGAFATSYIPTVASQVTRSPDLCSIVAPMFSPWYNQSEGAWVVEADSVGIGSGGRTGVAFAGSVSPAYFHASGTSANFDGTNLVRSANTATSNIPAKIGGSYGGGLSSVLNGGTVATGAYSGGFSGRSSLLLGDGLGGLNGHIRRITYYPFRASNNQLQALTT